MNSAAKTKKKVKNRLKSNIIKDLEHAHVPVNSQLCTVEGNYKVAIKKYGKM